MPRYGPFVLVVLLALSFLGVVLVRSQRRMRSAKSRNIWDYVFLWPIVLDRPERRKRVASGGRVFTTRELVWVAVFVLVLIVGVTFF